MGSSPSINIPAQQNYSEAMADSLKAQVDLLRGSGNFADTGGLQNLLETYEAPLRKSTAQTDTDILKQTLLGRQRDAVTGTYDEQGRLVTGQRDVPGETVQGGDFTIKTIDNGSFGRVGPNSEQTSGTLPKYGIYDESGKLVGSTGGQKIGPVSNSHWQMLTKQASREAEVLANERKTSSATTTPTTQEPVFATDDQGNIITDLSKAGQTASIPSERRGDGMIDLLGDSRMLEGEDRRAGFDEDNKFLGLSVLTEDIGGSQLSRSRERDLADVERLAGRYKGVMDEFKDQNIMTSIGEVGGPSDVFANDMIEQRTPDGSERRAGQVDPMAQATAQPATAQPAQAQPTQGQTATDPMLAQIAQTGTPTGAGLRETLANEALLGMGQGLTDREKRNIEQASRARATTLGRTFDVGSVEDEVTAKLLEDRNRLNQNRAFAQSVLGQEGGLRMQELALQQTNKLDPFQAILGRSGGSTVGQAQSILGGAGYGLQSGPAYLNPQAGIDYTSQAYANQAGLEAARMQSQGSRTAGIFQGLGSLGGGLLSGGYLPGGR
ncbi:hypothetical protein OAK38_06105 [Verrucomicrobia bacterium]|nr:hypothetical protein [Verrucomicrobiota bacterium]